MATNDISRRLFRPTQRYVGARMQSGRVLLDSCWNEGDDQRAEVRRRTTADVIGCSGSPDCGFELSLCAPYNVISAGVMYAGGLRLQLDSSRYLMGQPDLLKGPLLELLQRGELEPGWQPQFPILFYLEGFEAPVTPVEDRELFDPALGGVDTTTRVRRFARVLFDPRAPDDASTCEALWQRFVSSPPMCPGATFEDDCSLTSPVRMTVGFVDDLEADDECERCEPEFRRGYRLAEAQAIRVMLTRDGQRFVWGFENAAPLYRVRVIGKQVELLTAPRDEFHAPQPGQTVELLSWGALLPNGEKTAEPVGYFTTVAEVEGSRTLILEDDPTFSVTRVPPHRRGLYPEHEQHAIQCDTHLYMRVWRRGADRESPPTLPLVAEDGSSEHRLGFTGLTVRFDLDEGAEHGCPGDYWVVAARPEHRTQVVPWTLLEGERPHGPRRVYAPLAIARLKPPPGVQVAVSDELVAVGQGGGGFAGGSGGFAIATGGGGQINDFTTDLAVVDLAPLGNVLGVAVVAPNPCAGLGVGDAAAASFSCGSFTRLFDPNQPRFAYDAAQADIFDQVDAGSLVYEDCRPRFRSLTRRSGCCTVTAGPGCAYETLQDAVDALPSEGGRVCLVRGTLSGRLVIEGRRDIEIFGVGPSSIVTVDEPTPGSEPVIDVRDSERITLRGFTVTAQGVPGVRVWRDPATTAPTSTRLRELFIDAERHPDVPSAQGARAAIAIVNGEGDRVERCRLVMDGGLTGFEPVVYLWGRDLLLRRSEVLTTEGDAAIAWGGVQIDGGSERVRIVDNRIEAGLGHGVTLGGIAFVSAPLPALPLPEVDRTAIGRTVLELDPGEPTVDLIPSAPIPGDASIPTGHLSQIEVRSNVITGMGTSGIAVAGFFGGANSDPNYDYTHIERLEIADNTVVDNLRRAPNYPTLTLLDDSTSAAAGGIALGATYRTRIRSNEIRDNGRALGEPVVGIFGQSGTVEITRNRIVGNGRNLVEAGRGAVVGVRAAIALPGVIEPVDLDTGLPMTLPGARLVGNVIRASEGKAIQVATVASVSVRDNDIVTRGDNLPLDFVGDWDVTVGLLNGVGTGAVVDIRGLTTGPHATDPDAAPAGGTEGADAYGGDVVLEDNVITLDWPDKDSDPACSSVTIAAHESTVTVLRNQLLTRMHLPPPDPPPAFDAFVDDAANNTPSLMVCPCIVEGFAVQFSDNRVTEGYFEAAISAITWGMGQGNVTSQNASTHCVLVGSSPTTPTTVDEYNDELINLESVGTPFCGTLTVSPPDFSGTTTYDFR